ncbi:caspase family protein [Paraburkholderia strydomiana]|uniref:caspase family protein n=1 Tax=Paraburkholderia strydomiana TaxID=1245417 RepID=UPI0038BA5818
MTALSVGGQYAVTGSDDGRYSLWDSASGRELQSLAGYSDEVSDVALSLDGRHLLSGEFNGTVRLGDFSTAREPRRLDEFDVGISSLSFSPDGRYALTVAGDSTCLYETVDGHRVHCLESLRSSVSSIVFSPDGHFILTGTTFGTTELWETESGKHVRQFKGHSAPVDAVAFSPDGRYVLTGSQDNSARLWERDTGLEVQHFIGHPLVSGVAILSNLSYVVTIGADKTIRVWSVRTGKELVRLVSFKGGAWAVVAPDGKFDSSWLEEVTGLNWQMPDDPLRVLPFEIFQRDYYEPRLLPRLLACNQVDDCGREFRPLRPLVELNRLQPKVTITEVRRGSSSDVALVDVAVAAMVDPTQKNGKYSTAVYDLRLYRAGQLVGQWPEPRDVAAGAEQSDELGAWRYASRVPMQAGRSEAVHTFNVRLPAKDRGKPLTFTAYAFNDDRVKSETASYDYIMPRDIAARVPRAYVVTVGVDAYQNKRRDLGFAVSDAKYLTASLRRIRDYEVVSVTLLAASKRSARGERVVTVDHATKADVRAVLDVLAGKPGADRKRLRAVPGSDQLTHASPDDLVVMSFSGHGYTAPGGRFYLLPSDSGLENDITDAVLPKFISSDELGYWLRGVDAGQMTLIIDACHSAASVEKPGFKPGPMGDRGLGQLAYDKGMRILAASQADDVALESEQLGHGLLTYALVHDGLGRNSANPAVQAADRNGDGAVDLAEWLQYGENRVPQLYEEILTGKRRALSPNSFGELALISRDSRSNPEFASWVEKRRAQTPTLFNYQRSGQTAVIDSP